MAGEDQGVNYSIKELIARLDVKLDVVLQLIAEKADRSALEALVSRVGKLETGSEASKAVATNSRWLIFIAIPTTASVIIAVVNFLGK